MQDSNIVRFAVLKDWVRFIKWGAIAGLIINIIKYVDISILLVLFTGEMITFVWTSKYMINKDINKYKAKGIKINTHTIMINSIIINVMHLFVSFFCIYWMWHKHDGTDIIDKLVSLWTVRLLLLGYVIYIIRVIYLAFKAAKKYEIAE